MVEIIKNIVICGSAKYIEEINVFANKLRDKEYDVIDLKMVPYPSTYDPLEKLANKEFYFDKIKEADLILVYDKDGYVGLATAMEIQFSLDDSGRRPVRFLYVPEKIEFRAIIMSPNYNATVDSRWLNI